MLSDANLHYLDNAATTIPSPAVADAIRASILGDWGNPSSLYRPGMDSQQHLNTARVALAKTLGCTPGEFYFTGCGSEGNNLAILGAAQTRKGWGNRIVVSGFEHPSAALPCQRLAAEGFDVQVVPPGADGNLNVEEMLARVNKTTILVACMLVNNETGAVVDIPRLAAGVRKANPRTAIHVDAVQGWLRMPFKLDNIDSLTVSGHKVHAPKGIGGLYLRKSYNIEPPYLGGGQERGIRPGTENVPYAVGLATAAAALQKDMRPRTAHIAELNRRLREGLRAFPDVTLNSPDHALPEVLNCSTHTVRSETMLHFLETKNIYVSSGSACSKGAVSHTLGAMGCDANTMDTALRISFCGDNTAEDVDALLTALDEGLHTLAGIKR